MSFSPSVTRHQDMYKSPSRVCGVDSNESPSWRNTYKKRCFEEFKKSRQKLLGKFRCLQVNDTVKPTKLKDYLEEELEKICLLEAKTNPSLISIDEAAEIYKQIQSELLAQQDDELVLEMVNEDAEFNETRSEWAPVVCPVCQRANLAENSSFITCTNIKAACKFNIDKSKTSLDLSALAGRLDDAVKTHACSEVPSFQFKNMETLSDRVFLSQLSLTPLSSCILLMSCDKCNFMRIIV